MSEATPPYRVLVVDDEPPARRRLRELLALEPDFALAAECADGLEAERALRRERYDLVLLDVQMPGRDGFDVVRAVGVQDMPAVVFVTAYDEFAVEAFELHALDYLLKPFDRERFRTTLERARLELRRRTAEGIESRLRGLLRDAAQAGAHPEHVVARSGRRIVVVAPERIDWIRAAGNYLRVHSEGAEHLARGTMKAMQARLAAHGFVRIHRSVLVNAARIRELHPTDGGEFRVHLQDGTVLTSGRQYRDAILRFLE